MCLGVLSGAFVFRDRARIFADALRSEAAHFIGNLDVTLCGGEVGMARQLLRDHAAAVERDIGDEGCA